MINSLKSIEDKDKNKRIIEPIKSLLRIRRKKKLTHIKTHDNFNMELKKPIKMYLLSKNLYF